MTTLVHLTTIHPRADARILVREAQTLAARLPHRVVLMVADGHGSIDNGPGQVAVHDLGNLGSRLRRAVVGPWRALLAIRQIKPAVVHFHDPELILVGMVLRLLGYAVIYDVHEDVPRQVLTKYWLPTFIRVPVSWGASIVEWIASRVLTALVPATEKIGERFPTRKTVTVQNFPVISELVLAEPIPYDQRAAAFVCPGAIADIRGGVEMVQAMHRLGRQDARLHLAGFFSPAAFGDTLRATPGWHQVVFHGEVSRKQVAQLLGSARAGLVLHHPIPNEVEARPIKTFEYMSAGLPVIASDFPAWRRVIGDVGCGVLVNPLDVDAIAEAMRWVLEHPEDARQMGERGREAIARIYNWESEAAKLVGLYQRVLTTA